VLIVSGGEVQNLALSFLDPPRRTIAERVLHRAAERLGQFVRDYHHLQQQGLPFYENYVLHQITGFMSHWMTFSGQLMLVLLLLISLLLFAEESPRRRWRWLGVVLLSLALLAAFTRGVWLGTLAGMTFLVACYRRWMVALVPAILLLLYLVSPSWLQRRDQSIFNPKGDSSIMARLVMVRTGLHMMASHPVFGLGPERVGVEFGSYQAPGAVLPEAWYGHLHNTFLQIGAERGIPCLIVLLWLFFEVIRENISKARSSRGFGRALAIAALSGTVGMMVSGLFEYNFGDSEVLMLYLMVISLPHAWARFEPPQPPAPAVSTIL